MMFGSVLEGFLLSIGLIMAVGPQNAYVLRQGLRHKHVAAVATTCFLSDALLISLGVYGVGQIIKESATLSFWLGWGGVAFLLWFAGKSIRSALKPEVITDDSMHEAAGAAAGKGVTTAILHALAFTFLNPWVYIDTMVLIGGVSVKYDEVTRSAFLLGAVMGSAVWFYSLGFGAKKAAPLFRRTVTWRVLDSIIACVMIGVAITLVQYQLG